MNKDINKKSKNLKIKIISLIGAISMWLYVVAVVDPEDKREIVNIPITITNKSKIYNEGYVIYPENELKTDITVEGKLSEIQKLNKNNIKIYGEIIDPVEGKNVINLYSNISNRVSRELKDSSYVINLEKKITKKVEARVNIPDQLKDEVSSASADIKVVQVSGPRSLVEKVSYVSGSIGNIEHQKSNEKTDKTVEVGLVAYTEEDTPVKIDILPKKLSVNIKFFVEKVVPIKLDYDGSGANSFSIDPEKITLIGENETLKNIDSVVTEKVKDSDFNRENSVNFKLMIPENLKVKEKITEVEVSKKE